jgi:hypothetical protein
MPLFDGLLPRLSLLRKALHLLKSEWCDAGRRNSTPIRAMKKQGNTQLVLALVVLVAFLLLLVDSLRTSPLTFVPSSGNATLSPPGPIPSNDPEGHMPYTWEIDNWDINLNPLWFADHYHIPTGIR